MSIGTGIFFGLACMATVFLYTQTKDRWRWGQISKSVALIVAIPLVLGFLWLGYATMKSYLESRPERVTDYADISLGDATADVLYAKGQPTRLDAVQVWQASAAGNLTSGSGSTPPGLTVGPGGKVYSTVDGSQVNLIGAAIVSLEEPDHQGARWPGIAGLTSADYTTAVNNAYNSLPTAAKPYGKINFIRVPVSSLAWEDYSCLIPFADDAGTLTSVGGGLYKIGPSAGTYRTYVHQTVAAIRGAALYALIDLHNSVSKLTSTGQCIVGSGEWGEASPYDVTFWTDIASDPVFKNDPGVMYEILNEPHYDGNFKSAISTAGVIAEGSNLTFPLPNPVGAGCVTDDNLGAGTGGVYQVILGGGKQCTAVGQQVMIDAIRATGATNIIWAAGPWFSGGIDHWLQEGLHDPIHQLGAAFHAYGYHRGFASFQAVQATGYPILTTEMGSLGNIPSTYVQFRANGMGYCWWAGFNGQWDNFGFQTSAQIAAIMATNPPWKNNGSPTPTGSN